MSTSTNTLCPIWGTHAVLLASGGGAKVDSPRAGGIYRISGTAQTTAQHLQPQEKARLTTWIIEQHRAGEEAPLIKDEHIQQAKAARALSYSERKARFFLGLSARRWSFNDSLKLAGQVDDTYFHDRAFVASWTEISDENDIGAFARLLHDEGLLDGTPMQPVRLSAKGFQELEAAERGLRPSSQGFVAMWFDAGLDAVYQEGFAAAIARAGFSPLRIDKKEHNNKIDDEIIAEIKRSRFIVADFTCGKVTDGNGDLHWVQRGGVYFEAGYAYGLGIPVIWTCKKGHENGMHFDTRQFAHILWEEPTDLEAALYNRIVHVVGTGPRAG